MAKNFHILFDGRNINERMCGISRHLINLITGLNKIAPQNRYSVIINNDNALEHFGDKINIIRLSSKSHFLKEKLEILNILKTTDVDLYHTPSCERVFLPKYFPYILTMHDLEYVKSLFKINLNNLFNNLFIKNFFKDASRIITVSEFSKKTISEYFELRKNHINVVYNGIEDKFFTELNYQRMQETKKKLNLPDQYLLYIGACKHNKNIKGIVQAYLKANLNIPLVMSVFREELETIIDSKLINNIICIGKIENIDIKNVYSLAKLFIFPSLYEGFGLPVIEAFACKVPVITSNLTSLPEISRGAAIEVNPNDISSISDAIKYTINDENLRTKLIELGYKRAKVFTIENMAKAVLSIYKEIII